MMARRNANGIALRKKTLTTVDHLIDKDSIPKYINAQNSSENALEYGALHPDKLDELNRNAFALELVMNSMQPETDRNLDEITVYHTTAITALAFFSYHTGTTPTHSYSTTGHSVYCELLGAD